MFVRHVQYSLIEGSNTKEIIVTYHEIYTALEILFVPLKYNLCSKSMDKSLR